MLNQGGAPRTALPDLTHLGLLTSQLLELPVSDYQWGGISGPRALRALQAWALCCAETAAEWVLCDQTLPIHRESWKTSLPGWEFTEA